MTTAIYFSATDTTKRITEEVASCSPGGFSPVDITRKVEDIRFAGDDTVVVGMPVYAGRIPQLAAERLAKVSGDGTKCIALVVYGNRDYDDALLELCDILKAQGFNVVAAGAFIAEHCIFPTVAAGRPDHEDLEAIRDFASLAFTKSYPLDLSQVKGKRPYKEYTGVQLHPSVDEQLCDSCGTCAVQCPTAAISKDNPRHTDNEKCIACCRCIHVCPTGARGIRGEMYEGALQRFTAANSRRRQPEWFV